MEIINQEEILDEIKKGKKEADLDTLLKKASYNEGLSPIETSALFQRLDDETSNIALQLAAEIKSKVKGTDASLYTCNYITNYCVNDCGYCGFRSSNDELERITLTQNQIFDEAKVIKEMGVTNIILVGGTLPEEEYIELIIDGTKITKQLSLNPWIEFENLSFDALQKIKSEGANHFVLFQETYNIDKFRKLHKGIFKHNYYERLRKIEEAWNAGFENIGIGALFGLNDSDIFDLLGLYHHTKYLQQKGANVCISVPTLKPAPSLSISSNRISEQQIEKIHTTLRLALPSASLALSGRESQNLRNKLFSIVDQIGTGGTPNPGGRTAYKREYERGDTQFVLYDTRRPQEIRKHLETNGIKVVDSVNWG